MNNTKFEFITNLQYKAKTLSAELESFKSGEKYIKMNSNFDKQLAAKDQAVKKLGQELAKANSEIIKIRNMWFEVFEDMEKEHRKKLLEKDLQIKKLEEKLLKWEEALDDTKGKLKEKTIELYEAKTELEEEKEKTQKLIAQINRDYENSSLPSSSKDPNKKKKIANSREETDRKPGGQPGHKGHSRKKHMPTNSIFIPAPEKYTDNPDYKPTGKIISKQVVNLKISLIVDEYTTPEFRDVHTGQRVHAGFPEGLVNEVTYGGTVKAFAFLLNNHCNVSINKVRGFLSEITDGGLEISTGMINGLAKSFSEKTGQERKRAFSSLLLSPVMNTDLASVRLNGKNVNVVVCATPGEVMYFAREHKGHKAIEGTPVEDYQGSLVHDHDKTFYSYGSLHQECLTHILRYLIDSMENEPSLTWNKLMWGLIRAMIHYRNSLPPDAASEPEKVEGFEAQYQEILKTAKDEYEYEPPSQYYKDGFNLYIRLDKYRDSHLLFLHDLRVPATNNLSERLLRLLKRKSRQVMSFRSFDSLSYLCDSLGVVASLRSSDQNLYSSVASIYDNKISALCS